MEKKTGFELLKSLIENGTFDHATYRCVGTVHEGLWIYAKDENGFRGYTVAGCINCYKNLNNPELGLAYELLISKGIGTHYGSYGNG